jgi:hypothetical protein
VLGVAVGASTYDSDPAAPVLIAGGLLIGLVGWVGAVLLEWCAALFAEVRRRG